MEEESEEMVSEAFIEPRDDERERRRLRDRQRRQSMTVEQRERHLARRRRNYQLRRLRADSSCSKQDTISGGETVISSENPELSLAQEKCESECPQSSGQETLETKSADVAKTVRLSRIRCLARSPDHRSDTAGITSKSEAQDTMRIGGFGRLLGGVRLSRFKCLARGLNTDTNKTGVQAEQDMPCEGAQMTA